MPLLLYAEADPAGATKSHVFTARDLEPGPPALSTGRMRNKVHQAILPKYRPSRALKDWRWLFLKPARKQLDVVHIVLGDLHGCGVEFQQLLEAIQRTHAPRQVELILLGDLFTKGPRPDLVIEGILSSRRQGMRVTLICGNHELRLLAAINRMKKGVKPGRLPRHDRETIERLVATDSLDQAIVLLEEASRTVDLTLTDATGRFTAVHAGIEPVLGLSGTPDHLKMHIKARKSERDWWERYDGRDGLIIFGHKPVPEPIVVRDATGEAIAINVDTGCILGGHLTAYNVTEGCFLQIRSQQPINKERLEFALSPTVGPIEQQLASDVPYRTSAS